MSGHVDVNDQFERLGKIICPNGVQFNDTPRFLARCLITRRFQFQPCPFVRIRFSFFIYWGKFRCKIRMSQADNLHAPY